MSRTQSCAIGRFFRVWLVLLLLATFAIFAEAAQKKSAPPPPDAREDALAHAEQAMDRQSWDEAEPILRKLAAENPKDARPWFDLGYVMHARGNDSEAIAAYRNAVAAQPSSFECNLNLGLVLAHAKQPDASKFLEMATQLKPTGEHPQQQLAHAWAALAEVRAGDTSSLNAWSRAVELDPNEARYRVAYGEALEKSGDRLGAERELRKAGEADPASADAQVALANFYMRAHRMAEAEAALRRVTATSSGQQNETAHLQLGRVFSVEEKYAEADAELHKALALRPEDTDALRELAYAQLQEKQHAAAEQSYRTLLVHFPNEPELHNGLGLALLPQLKYAEAQHEFLEAVRLKPDMGETYEHLAWAASGNKDYSLAIRALDTRRKFLPEKPATYFLRATSYDHLRQFPAAVENYKAFLSVSNGEFPDEEWKARHRLIAIDPEARGKK